MASKTTYKLRLVIQYYNAATVTLKFQKNILSSAWLIQPASTSIQCLWKKIKGKLQLKSGERKFSLKKHAPQNNAGKPHRQPRVIHPVCLIRKYLRSARGNRNRHEDPPPTVSSSPNPRRTGDSIKRGLASARLNNERASVFVYLASTQRPSPVFACIFPRKISLLSGALAPPPTLYPRARPLFTGAQLAGATAPILHTRVNLIIQLSEAPWPR